MTHPPQILIAGIGNIFLGDDAFGVEVVQELLRHPPPPPNIQITDFGIRGMDLAYALLQPFDAAILVDAVPRNDSPGTLYLLEPNPSDLSSPADEPLLDAHSMDPLKVLRLAHSMGADLQRILILGCEPSPFDPETDMDITLTPPVRAAIPEAVAMIHSLIQKLQLELKGAIQHVPSIATH